MLRWMVWYGRSLLCQHVWSYDEVPYVHQWTLSSGGKKEYNNVTVSATCQKCGWHRSYDKWRIYP